MCNIHYDYSSEHGIPDYEDGSYDDVETFNSTNLSNKSKFNLNSSTIFSLNIKDNWYLYQFNLTWCHTI